LEVRLITGPESVAVTAELELPLMADTRAEAIAAPLGTGRLAKRRRGGKCRAASVEITVLGAKRGKRQEEAISGRAWA